MAEGDEAACALRISDDGRADGGESSLVAVVEAGVADAAYEHEAMQAFHNSSEMIPEQERFLPIANVARIMKRVVPEQGKVAKDAKECCQECVSEFISFVTSEASERCQIEKRKTINGEGVLYALQVLGFDNYVEPLKLYLSKYRDTLKGEKVASAGDGDAPEAATDDALSMLRSAQQPQTIQLQLAAGATRSGAQQLQQLPFVYVDANTGQNYVQLRASDGSLQLLQVAAVTPADSHVAATTSSS